MRTKAVSRHDERILPHDAQDGDVARSAVTTERRESRTFVEVALDFQMIDGDRQYQGVRLSRRTLAVRRAPGQRQPRKTSRAAAETGGVRRITLQIPLSGFELVVDLDAVPMIDPGTRDGLLRYRIAEGDVRTQTVLSQLVRIVLTGVLPGVDDLTQGQDDETPLRAPAATEQPARRSFIPVAVLGASVLALLLGAVTFGTDVWRSMTTIAASQAVLIAPRTDIVALDLGRADRVAVAAGAAVRKNDLLVQLRAPQLEAEVRAIEARVMGLDHIIAQLSRARAPRTMPDHNGTPLTLAVARDARDIEAGLLAALRKREDALVYRSPCDCTVQWAIDPGAIVSSGMRLVTLSRTRPEEYRVLARVPAERAAEIRAGQRATVKFVGGWGETDAAVEQIGGQPESGRASLRQPGDTVAVTLLLDRVPAGRTPGAAADVAIRK